MSGSISHQGIERARHLVEIAAADIVFPYLGAPYFDAVQAFDDHNVFFQFRVSAEIFRQKDAPLLVLLRIPAVIKEKTKGFLRFRVKHRDLGEFRLDFRHLTFGINGKAAADPAGYGVMLPQLFAELGGDSHSVFRVELMVIDPVEHRQYPLSALMYISYTHF